MLILGAARQGLAIARFLNTNGSLVTLNDKQSDAELAKAKFSLEDLDNISWITGGHPLHALANIDLLCLSGGVPLSIPIVIEAMRRGMAISNDTQIFMEEVPCKVIGITGSAGKTTTTTLVGRIAQRDVKSPNNAWVGGNIGNPLIADVKKMKENDIVVMEISSFQLEQMTISPNIAAVLNITPNHLDRHGTMAAYTSAKKRILDFQKNTDAAILNRDDQGSISLNSEIKGKGSSFGFIESNGKSPQVFIRDHQVFFKNGEYVQKLLGTTDVALRGEHNLMNVLAACAISCAAGFSVDSIQNGIIGFSGVPHRLQLVREFRGAKWYNDSIATAPERTMAGLRSFTEPIILLAGGRDKDLPWDDFAKLAHQKVEHLILFGEAAELINQAISKVETSSLIKTIDKCSKLEEAVHKAANYGKPGYIVLLSPGGTSFDEFIDFEQRGEAYSQWVLQLS